MQGAAKDFKQLIVWQRAMELAVTVYKVTQHLAVDEQFGLRSQMRRAAVSIPSNIAEGSKRGTQKDFVQFLRIAAGSAAELETQLLLLEKLYPACNIGDANALLIETEKMLSALIKSMSQR